MSLVITISLLILATTVNCGRYRGEWGNENTPGMFDKIKSGLQMAGKLLGLDAASGVAQLVADTFSNQGPAKGETEDAQTQNGFVSKFFRLLGLDTGKLGAIALNGIIFIAQLINKTFSTVKPPEVTYNRKFENMQEGSPFDWVILAAKRAGANSFLEDATDPKLTERLVQHVQENNVNTESACVQLFVCKISPIIWAMQKKVNKQNANDDKQNTNDNNENDSKPTRFYNAASMLSALPNLEEVADHGDECETQYSDCKLYY